ncbi:peptide synthase [Williamsia sp. CHRR-6]|nr:condensation domain-containing protein [Williamsia sp. CHRR-6]MBT0566864.1 peptide synthase [Williamsia sp. CHRR-6]
MTTIDRWSPAPGALVVCELDPSGAAPVESAIPPSFNQQFHLAAASAPGAPHTWLAASFDVTGGVDRKALEAAYAALVRRHPTLHSSFEPHAGQVARRTLRDPDQFTYRTVDVDYFHDTDELRDTLWTTLDERCDPFGTPSYVVAAIDRPERSTIICGFDHIHVDAYSIAIVVADMTALYAGFRAEPGSYAGADLPPTGSFLEFCAEQHDETRAADPNCPTLGRWVEFFTERHNIPPTFPLDLGVGPSERHPQAVLLDTLVDADALASVETHCRASGASVFAGVLSAMAHAVHDQGGPRRVSMLFPMHTRRSRRHADALGWFTTNAPMVIDLEPTLVETMHIVGPALRDAISLGEVNLGRVVEAIGGLNLQRNDIFMVSYVDYRRLPGSDEQAATNATHVSNVTTADDAQFWVSRTDSGLALRVRYPDNPVASATIAGYVTAVRARLLDLIGR